MNKYFYVASRLAKKNVNPAELEQIRDILLSQKNDEQLQLDFFNYCKQWKLTPWIWCQLNSYRLLTYIFPSIKMLFQDYYNSIKEENENRNKEAQIFLQEFIKKGIDVIVLKGNLFMHSIYKDPGYKKMNDFDMLVHLDDWPKIQETYFGLGYIPLGFGWSGEKQEAVRFSHTGMSFISKNYHCITGTQWGLKSPTSKYNKSIIGDIWSTSQELDYSGLSLKQLSPEYNLLHLILHMGVYKCGIRDCMDVYNLYNAGIDEDRFLTITKEANASEKAYFTFTLTNLCCGDISQLLLKRLCAQSKGFLLRRTNARLKMADRTGDMQLSYNDYFQDVEMSVFYFNLFTKMHQKLPLFTRIFALMLFPNVKVALQFCDKSDRPTLFNKLIARLKAPYFTFRLVGEEIGIGITFLLFFKLFIDSFLSLKFYFVKKETYFEYLKNRGIDPKEIKAAVKKIQ